MIASFDQTRIHRKNLLHAVSLCFDKLTQPLHQKTHSHCTDSWSNFILRELTIFTVKCTIFISCIISSSSFFKLAYLLAERMQNICLFWPVLAILSRFYALVGILFTGLNIVVAYQKWQIQGMGIDSNTHNTTIYWIQLQRQVLLPRRWNRHHVCNPDYHDHNQEVDNENSGGGQTGRRDVFLSAFDTFIFMMY